MTIDRPPDERPMTDQVLDGTLETRSSVRRLLNIPNQLTIARLLLSLVFFVVLALDEHEVFGTTHRQLVLNFSLVLFVLAVSTDFLDGFLARRWGMTSTFGRIADPFADKIIICGGFIMMIDVSELVQPWFAVTVLFREFLVSGLRSFLESRGIPFGASWSGKIKMVSQSITIPVILFYEANFPLIPGQEPSWISRGFEWLSILLLATTLVSTVGSSVGYLRRANIALRTIPPGD